MKCDLATERNSTDNEHCCHLWNRRPTELGITHPGLHHLAVNSVERFNCDLLDEWAYTRLWT